MKTIYLSISFFLLFTFNSFGQLNKKTWLVGGTGSFDSYKQNETFIFQGNGESNEILRTIKEVEFSPKIGYFIIDKLVLGIGTSFTSEKSDAITITGSFGDSSSKSHSFSIGPFARYYFLKKDMPYNILAEGSYQLGSLNNGNYSPEQKGKLTNASFFVGPELFFNSSVGIDLLVGYKTSARKMDNPNTPSITKNGFQVAFGLQIHLEKL